MFDVTIHCGNTWSARADLTCESLGTILFDSLLESSGVTIGTPSGEILIFVGGPAILGAAMACHGTSGIRLRGATGHLDDSSRAALNTAYMQMLAYVE